MPRKRKPIEPKRLHDTIKAHMDSDDWFKEQGYEWKENAAGECDTCVRHVLHHVDIPNAQSTWYKNNAKQWTHNVIQVPTTEGDYVVDLTHRQFDMRSKHPLIEPKDRFEARQVMRKAKPWVFGSPLEED